MQKKITLGVLFLAFSAILFTSCNNQTTNSSSSSSSSSSSISTSLLSSSSSSSSIPSSSSIKNEISISVSGPKAVRYGNTIELTVNVTGTENKTVIWKKSSDLISISNNIVSVTRQVEEDTEVTITVQPVADLSKEYSFVITVLAPEPDPVLTQDMLDVLKTDRIEFNGTTTIDLYSIASDKYYSTTIIESYTNMKDNFWSAAYANSTTGKTEYLIYENYQGNACQVGLSLMNEESYTPITDDNGLPVKWEDANLYNPLTSLSVENFTYNKESGLFDYNGTNEKLLSQLSSSCTPYEFDAVKFSLRVEYNQITSIVLVTGEDYRVQTGYKAIQTLEAYFNTGDLVKYPYINKYTLEEEHKTLQNALEKMKSLESYTTTVQILTSLATSSAVTYSGYQETITKDAMYYQDLIFDNQGNVTGLSDTGTYGYKKINDNLYNSFGSDANNKHYATREFVGSIDDAKPSFAFSPAIFNPGYKYYQDSKTTVYFSYDAMSKVAETFYKAPGNELCLYGMFATRGYTSSTSSFTPYVVINDEGYITQSYFYSDLGLIKGLFVINYGNFNTASIPDDCDLSFDNRVAPTSWKDVTTLYYPDEGESGVEYPTDEIMTTYLGDENANSIVPYFPEALGDCYGLSSTSIYQLPNSNRAVKAIQVYLDVPLDSNYSIDSSLLALKLYFIEKGFVNDGKGGYTKDGYTLVPVDSDLDLFVYIYKNPTNN